MAVIAAQVVNWGGSPAPHSTAELVSPTTVAVGTVAVTAPVLPAPEVSSGSSSSAGVGYAC